MTITATQDQLKRQGIKEKRQAKIRKNGQNKQICYCQTMPHLFLSVSLRTHTSTFIFHHSDCVPLSSYHRVIEHLSLNQLLCFLKKYLIHLCLYYLTNHHFIQDLVSSILYSPNKIVTSCSLTKALITVQLQSHVCQMFFFFFSKQHLIIQQEY